jgi:O-antigen/teichoic acid export membrane protein
MKINQIKAGAALSYVSMGLGYIVSVIYTPVMLRLLGQSEYGLYNLAASVIAYLGLLSFGFGSAYMRFYSIYKVKEDREKIAKLNGMFIMIFSVIGLIAVIAGTILAFNTGALFKATLSDTEMSRAKTLMIILAVNLAVSFLGIVFNSHITANEKFVFQNILQMLRTATQPFVVLPALLMGFGSVGMAIAVTVLNIAIELANAAYCVFRLKMRFDFRRFDFKLMKEMIVFSSYILIYMIIDQVNWNVDKLIVGIVRGTGEVAVYSLGAQLNTYLINISTAMAVVFTPRIHRIVARDPKDRELTDLFIKVGRAQFIIVSVVLIGFLFFGKAFISLWAGENYLISYYIALILMLATSWTLIQNIGVEIRKAQNKHKTPAKFMLFVTLINIVVSIPLAKAYGAVGSTIGTAAAMLINWVFLFVYYKKVVGLDMVLFFKEIASLSKGIIVPVIAAAFIKIRFSHLGSMAYLSLLIPFTAIYFITMYLWGMNDYEKRLFRFKFKIFDNT